MNNRSAVKSLNYNIVQSYYNPVLFKSNASSEVLYDILRVYKKNITKEEDFLKNVKEGTYKERLLQKPVSSFETNPIFIEKEQSKERQVKYFPNPTKNWGPKGRPKVESGSNKKSLWYVINKLIKKIF